MKPPYLPEQQEWEPPVPYQPPEDYQYNPVQAQRSWRDVLRRNPDINGRAPHLVLFLALHVPGCRRKFAAGK